MALPIESPGLDLLRARRHRLQLRCAGGRDPAGAQFGVSPFGILGTWNSFDRRSQALILTLPAALYVVAILHANNYRDIEVDKQGGWESNWWSFMGMLLWRCFGQLVSDPCFGAFSTIVESVFEKSRNLNGVSFKMGTISFRVHLLRSTVSFLRLSVPESRIVVENRQYQELSWVLNYQNGGPMIFRAAAIYCLFFLSLNCTLFRIFEHQLGTCDSRGYPGSVVRQSFITRTLATSSSLFNHRVHIAPLLAVSVLVLGALCKSRPQRPNRPFIMNRPSEISTGGYGRREAIHFSPGKASGFWSRQSTRKTHIFGGWRSAVTQERWFQIHTLVSSALWSPSLDSISVGAGGPTDIRHSSPFDC